MVPARDVPRAVVEVVDGDVAVATVRIDGAVPGLFVVDAVARIAVAAGRLGWTVRVCDPELAETCDLVGLRRELRGEPERREEAGVEEVVQPDEPPA